MSGRNISSSNCGYISTGLCNGHKSGYKYRNSENQPSDSEQIEENQVQNAIEQHLNYLYIESPYVETPATQRLVVSWGDGTENIEEIDLSVEHNGDTQTWTSVKSEDGVFLYEKAYADGEDGIYTITKLTVKTAEMETSYLLSDLGMEAKFGVNETYEGMSELQRLKDNRMQKQQLMRSSMMLLL